MNVFGIKIGHRNTSQQTERTPSPSPQASPLPPGRAGRLQRQNALSPNIRYNARSTPSTPDRARASSLHGGAGSSSPACSSEAASPSRGFTRQAGRRENAQLAQFHDTMRASPKMSRNDPIPETPPETPARLQQKMDAIDLPKLKSLDKDLYHYAQTATELVNENNGSNAVLTRMDKKMLPLIAEAENARHPGLNLHVFKGADECYKAIREQNKQVWSSKQPMNMRVVFPPSKGMPDHQVALDVQFRPGHRPSVVCFESGQSDLMEINKMAIEHGLKGAKVKMVGNLIQASHWDCAMYALNNALKSFKHHDEYTARVHSGETDLSLPAEFLKHAQPRSLIRGSPNENDIVSKDKGGLHAETLMHRNLAYRAQRFKKAYSTSIEGFRFQEIQRAGDYLAAQRGRK
ncbi:avirulence protein [Erwinia psidii]|uniref:Epo1 n=1 Tax=Erwinia psidii TaxID=69224 RepID=A0A8E6MA92_9GAMM|nr:YopJ family acetyltransferase [Erwinia psidii]MCX8964080.1 avirulence protein [Erwinia psidii]QVN30078.1 Epo1 [Erwinia psidii]